MSERAFLIDTTKCHGCLACQTACKQWNEIPGEDSGNLVSEYTSPQNLSAITWNHVKFYDVIRHNDVPVWQIMHRKCNHCRNANCEAVCHFNAIYRLAGMVVIDQDKCIGCGACTESCVYKVPHIAEKSHPGSPDIIRNKSYKCNGCKIKKRDIPACVSACPGGALSFGYRYRIIQDAGKRLKIIKKTYPNASIYGLDQFGGLNVITILKDSPELFGLPMDPKSVNRDVFQDINSLCDIFSLFIPGYRPARRIAYKLARALTLRGRAIS